MKIASVLAVSGMFLAVSAMPYQAGAQQKDNVLTQKEKNAGWILLFDGKSADGWHSFNKTSLGSAWEADNGTLHLTKHEGESRYYPRNNHRITSQDLKIDRIWLS